MTNQEFEYFNWGIHETHSADYYAIANQTVSRLYLVGENYKKLKLIQFILMTSAPTLMINLSKIKNYEPGLLDNGVCLNWRIQSPLGSYTSTGLAADYKSRGIDQLSETGWPTDSDIEFQRNLFYLIHILREVDSFVNKHQVDTAHNQELLNYFKIVLPNDTALHKQVEIDQEKILEMQLSITEYRNSIIRILSNLNYTKPFDKLQSDLRSICQDYNFGDSDTAISYKKYLLEKL